MKINIMKFKKGDSYEVPVISFYYDTFKKSHPEVANNGILARGIFSTKDERTANLVFQSIGDPRVTFQYS